MTALKCSLVTRHYGIHGDTPALNGISFSVRPGEFVAIEGPSGAGKSTLLSILGLLDKPDSGSFAIGGVETSTLTPRQAAVLRSDQIGLIFQSFHLLDARPVVDSVELGLLYRGVPASERRRAAMRALDQVHIAHLADKPSRLLSGGERQRVAVARALATGSPVLLADEPTGNLDTKNARILLDNLSRLHKAGTTIVLVTHSENVARYAQRRVVLVDGVVQSDTEQEQVRRPEQFRNGWSESSGGGHVAPMQGAERGGAVLGRGSRLLVRDVLKDAWSGIAAKMGRTLGVASAVAVGVGLAVTTLGLSFSASAQVADTFDARTNRDVSVSWVDSLTSLDVDAGIASVADLNGVESTAALEDLGPIEVSATARRSAETTRLVVASGDMSALRMDVRSANEGSEPPAAGEALVGAALSASIYLGPVEARPVIFVEGHPLTVVGIIEQSPRKPELVDSIMVSEWDVGDAERYVTLYARTDVGAAQQVSHEAPVAVDPYQPEDLVVTAPPDPLGLRAEVEGQVTSMLTFMTAVAIAGGAISLVSAMLLAVGQRVREIGLRRAVGARGVHIAALMTTEASMIGLMGGVAGLVLGLVAILATSAVNGWVPVFDLVLGPIAVAVGIGMGALAGLVAGRRAARIEPQAALRGA